MGYCPLGSPNRPHATDARGYRRYRGPGDRPHRQRLGVHRRWSASVGVGRGQTPIPLSDQPRNYLANLRSAVTEPLADGGHARHRGPSTELPAYQRPGIPLESRTRAGKTCGTWMERSSHDARRLLTGQQHRRTARASPPRAGTRRSAPAHEGIHHLRLRHSLHLSRASGQRPGGISGRGGGP